MPRAVHSLLLALCLSVAAHAAAAATPKFDFDDVVSLARALSGTTQRLPESGL